MSTVSDSKEDSKEGGMKMQTSKDKRSVNCRHTGLTLALVIPLPTVLVYDRVVF